MAERVPPVLGVALTALRTKKGLSQKELARAAGISHHLLWAYENGKRTLYPATLAELAATLGYEPGDVDVLLFSLEWLEEGESIPAAGSPAGPTPAERRSIRAGAAAAARGLASTLGQELARRVVARRARRQRREAREPAERLLRSPPTRQRYLVEVGEEYRTWAVCERICAASERAAAADAGRALALAELALFIARHTPGGELWRARVEGYAWVFVGNARRVAGKLRWANEAFAESRRLWQAGAEADLDVLAEGLVLDLEASLRRDQRRLAEALDLHERALAATPRGRHGSILLNKSKVQFELEDYEGALLTLRQASSLVSTEREPRLAFGVRFNLAGIFCHLGRHAEAEQLLSKARELALQLDNGLDFVRLRWLEGWIATGYGRTAEALAALEQVRGEFAARTMDYDMALVSLELAALYLERGETSKVKNVVREMAPVFRREGVHREALAALQIFSEAAANERATAEMARCVHQYLERARHEPGLRFEV